MDRRLAGRIAGTLGLVVVIDFLLALALAIVLEPWFGGVFVRTGITSSTATIAVLAALVGTGLFVLQLRYSRRELLAEADATVVDVDESDVTDRVTRLAAQVDMPVPDVAIADSSAPNSLAIGDLGSGTIVVSRELVERLDGPELDAVLAHELVHLKNRDALVLTVASFLPALVADDYTPLGNLPASVRSTLWGGGLIGSYVLASTFLQAPPGSLASVGQFVVAATVTVLVGGIVFGVLAAAVLTASRSLSRYREFVADRAGARLTGNPAAMAEALATLGSPTRRPTTDKRRAARGLCLLPHGFETDGPEDDSFTVDTRSHPPIDERIARLREVAATLERGRERPHTSGNERAAVSKR